ncbi:MAG: helix-turn-helix domain-containing protein [Candidatus Sphingomonas phytovorans]|nr:helix-turn-helix domain-containing protein [Sphingomonas sp.]WEK02154.1 MAG: helix-turn-helix domain-containing protein [Sphingomonas sp.]
MTDPTDEAAIARAARARNGTPFVSPEQAAFYLGMSVRTLQEYRSAGTGPRYRRHSRHVRYHIDDLDAWSQRQGEAGDHE